MKRVQPLAVLFVSAALLASGSAPAGATDRDAARGILRNAVERYRALKGYQARFEKDELAPGGRPKNERSFLKFEKPFRIFMAWEEGEMKGAQLVYAEGENDDKLIVQLPGLIFNFIGPVAVAVDDPRVRKGQKHSIKKAGIGFFIEDLWKDYERLEAKGAIEVLAVRPGVGAAGERGTLVDFALHDPDESYPRKAVVFSEATGLPIEIRLYKPQDRLVETFRYLRLKPDPAADAPDFKRLAKPALFDKFAKPASK